MCLCACVCVAVASLNILSWLKIKIFKLYAHLNFILN